MAKFLARLKQLKDADVRYISLVDRAATRIPFRVLKRDKENKMGIDLTKVFKSDNAEKPYVSALVVFAQKDETAAAQVLEAIKTHGFTVDRVQKSDEGETLVYAQTDQPKDITIVRLSDQTLVNVANLKAPSGWVGEMTQELGFLPDLKTVTAVLFDHVTDVVSKSDNPQDDALAVLTSFAEYVSQMAILPANCFKLDAAIVDIIQKCECKDEKKPKEAVVKESAEDKKKRIAKHPPAEMAPVDEEDDQKPPPDAVEKADDKKDDDEEETVDASEAILAALQGIETTVSSLATKVETIATDLTSQKKVLDDVVQKADTLGTKLSTTVTAPPVAEDRPAANGTRMRVQKDEDPRTGNFDTAFLRRRGR